MLKEISAAMLLLLLLPLAPLFGERNIVVLNPYETPEVGGGWTVRFATNGTGLLKITNLYPDDVEFNSIYSAEVYADVSGEWKKLEPLVSGNTLYIFWNYNYGKVVYRVWKRGSHELRFEFGNTAHAYNAAGQGTQREFVLNLTDPIFLYEQTHLNTSDEGGFRFSGSETRYSGVSLPNNITLIYAYLNITGSITPTKTSSPGEIYDIKIVDILTDALEDGNETVVAIGGGGNYYTKVLNNSFYEKKSFTAGDTVNAIDIANIDPDLPGLEVVVGSDDYSVYLLNYSLVEIWSKSSSYVINDVAAGELNSTYNGQEIVAGYGGDKVTVFNMTGQTVWTIQPGGATKTVAVGDVNDSAGNEVVIGSINHTIIYDSKGSQLWNESIPSGLINAIDVENISGGAYEEIVLVDSLGYLRHLNSSRKWWNTYVGGNLLSVAAGEIDSSSDGLEIVVGTDNGEVKAFNSTGGYLWEYSVGTTREVKGIDIGNFTTEAGQEVVVGVRLGSGDNVYSFNFDNFPTESYIEIGGDLSSEWDWVNGSKFRGNGEITNGSMWGNISDYMDTCDAWLCDVPFTANSTYAGEFDFDLNVTYDYNLSSVVKMELVNVWSRTYEVKVNETMGNQSYNISFEMNPQESLLVQHVVLNETATLCHFNNTVYNMSASGCDVADFIVTPTSSLPPSALYWDNNMSRTMPVVINMSENFYAAPWKHKNITVRNDTTHGPNIIFYNVTANLSFAGQGFASPITFSVDWWSNGTFWNITPSTLTETCNTTSPTYESRVLGGETFFICGQDTDGDAQLDYIKWKQPHTFFNDSSQIDYMLNGTGNTPPVYWVDSVDVTPSTDIWGHVFNFSITFNDSEEDPVNATLYTCTPLTGCLANETLNSTSTTNYTFVWNITSWNDWVNSTANNYFYFEFKDPYIGWNSTENFYGPAVVRRDAILEPITNETVVNRTGTNTTYFLFRVYDPNATDYVGSGISCLVNVTENGSNYDDGNLDVTNPSGDCNITFDPDGNYSVGVQKFTVGVFNSSYYNDNITEMYGLELEIYGDLDVSLSVDPTGIVDRWNNSDRHDSNITWTISGVQDDNGTDVSGYTVWLYWRNSLLNTTDQSQGFIDIPDEAPLDQSDDYFQVVVGKQYFNNHTNTSADYLVEGKLNFTILTPNGSQVMRTLGSPNRLNLTINVTDELGNSVEDTNLEIVWYIPPDGCINLYNSSGNYTCEFNPGPATLGLYNWSVFVNRSDYDWVANLTDSWMHINGTMNLTIMTTTPFNRTVEKNIAARIMDEAKSTIVEQGHNCTWYIDGAEVGTSSTNSSGYCVMNWTSTCGDPLGKHTINVSITGVNSSFWTPITENKTQVLHLMDVFYITIDSPNNTIVHRGEPFDLNATVFDSCGPATGFNLTWYNETTNLTDGTEVNNTWTIPDNYRLNYTEINTTAIGGNYTTNATSFFLRVFGWAEPIWISPMDNITFGVEYNLTCLIRDNTTLEFISGYNASFWQNETMPPPHSGIDIFIGTGTTNSTGYALMNWTPLHYSGTYGVMCNLSHNETLWYNNSGVEALVVLPVYDNEPPSINETLISNKTVEANYEYTLIWANVTDDVDIDMVWAEIENDTSVENITLNFKSAQIIDGHVQEVWDYEYFPPIGGIYNVTVWVNDSTNHTVSQFVGNFTTIGHTTSDLWVATDDVYHAADEVTEYPYDHDTFWLDTYVNNTGNGTMYNMVVEFTGPSGIYFNEQPTYTTDQTNVTPGSSTTHTAVNVKTTTYPPLGNNTITITLKWQNANLTDGEVVNTTLVDLKNMTYIELTDQGAVIPPIVIDYIPNGTSRISKNITIEAYGTTELLDVNITFGTCDISSWLNFTPFWDISYIGKNEQNATGLNVTVPAGESPAIRTCEIIFNATGSAEVCGGPGERCDRQFTYELHIVSEEWNVTPLLLNKTVGQNSFGAIGTINVTNRGNNILSFNMSVFGAGGNVTAHNLTTNDEISNFTVGPFESVPVLARWNATGAEPENHTAEIVFDINDPLRIPQQENVTVFLNVTDVTFNIVWPHHSSPKTNVTEDDVINIIVDAQLGGTPIGTGEIEWSVSVGGELVGSMVEGSVQCNVINAVFNSIGDYMWNLNCTAPHIEGNVIDNMLFVEGNITAQSIVTNDYELDAVVYRDVTAPRFTDINSSCVQPGETFILHFNVTDNTGIANVTATFQYEDNAPTNITANLSYEGNNRWNCTLYGLTSVGDYWINVTAVDTSSYQHRNNTVVWFDVFNPVYFDGTMKDPLDNNVTAVFNFYVPSYKSKNGAVLAHTFNTSQSAEFNRTLHKRAYDLEILAFNHTLDYFNLSTDVPDSNISDYITLDNLDASSINVDPDITYYSVIGVYVGNLLSYKSAAIRINFTTATPYVTHYGLGDFYPTRFRVYRCDNWNFSSVSCSGSWTSAGGMVDNNPASPYYETVYLTTTSTSAFGLIQCERDDCAGPPEPPGPGPGPSPSYPPSTTTVCGNGICETGENSENCPQDCGEAALQLGAETTLSEVYMKPGENRTFTLTISNTHTSTKSVYVAISGEIMNYIKLGETFLNIPGQSSRTIQMVATIPMEAEPGAYTGDIIITSEGRSRQVPVTLIISLEGATSLQLALNALTKQVSPGETFKFNLIIYDLGLVKVVPVNLTYNVKDVATESITAQVEKSMVVESTQSLIESMDIPENASLGNYLIEVVAVYSNKTVSAIDQFEIVLPFWTPERIGIALIFIIAISGTMLAYYGRKRYMEWKFERAKYIFPISYRALPMKKENSIWLGKIAETNRKAWFYPDLMTTHVLVSGSTGSGKSVAASIIAEEVLEKKIPVIVFDPTAQWTGFVKPCTDKKMKENYISFGLGENDARPYKGMIFEVDDPNTYIDIKEYMNPGEITIFTLNKLKPGEYDTAVWNIVDSIFSISWEESTELKMIVVFDEVHRLLEKYGGRGGYVALEKAAREFRKWGIGLVMVSQVSSDFKEAIQGNVLTEVQMSTKSMTDIKRIESKFGPDFAKRISREAVGVGMLQNPKFNRGKPYFIEFRPTKHFPHKLPDKELEMYKDFTARLEVVEELISQKKRKREDVMDYLLELKLAKEKLHSGRFRMAKIYLDSLEQKLGVKDAS